MSRARGRGAVGIDGMDAAEACRASMTSSAFPTLWKAGWGDALPNEYWWMSVMTRERGGYRVRARATHGYVTA